MKNKILILLSFMIILFSFFLPRLLFEIEDFNRESQVFSVAKAKSKIDVQAEKIYLVKAIHAINESYRNVQISRKETVYYGDKTSVKEAPTMVMTSAQMQDEDVIKHLKNELLKLENGNILKSLNLNSAAFEIETRDFLYSNGENEYSMKQSRLKNEAYELNIETEHKTGKILCLFFPREKLQTEVEIEEILRSYVQYLELYIMDDWKFEDKTLKSEKAQLTVHFVQSEETYILSIRPMEDDEKQYEIVESAK